MRSTATRTEKPSGPGHNRPDVVCHHQVIYNLTCDEYEAMRARAGGHCEVCKKVETETPRGFLVVDHFHGRHPNASFIRGLLCDWCNTSVMQAFDGLKPWGANRRYEDAAREYELNSWDTPTAEALREMAARTEMLPVSIAPRSFPEWAPQTYAPQSRKPKVIEIPLGKGQLAIARKLRRYLTADQLARLAQLLTEENNR